MTRVRVTTTYLAAALLIYAIAFPVLTHYVDRSGFFCVLFAGPLIVATLVQRWRARLLTAAAGVIFNFVTWIVLGDGLSFFHHAPASALAGLTTELSLYAGVMATADRFSVIGRQLQRSRIRGDVAHRRLVESERKYRELIELAPEGIVVISEGKLAFANARFLQMSGSTAGRELSAEATGPAQSDDAATVVEAHAAQQGEKDPRERSSLRYVHGNGQVRWVEAAGQRITWNGRPSLLYFITDVTDRKAFEMQCSRTQKMEALGRLASGIAHDFNNVLHVILGSNSLMREHMNDQAALLRDVDAVETAASEAALLTRQLLSFGRRQDRSPRAVDLCDVVLQSKLMLTRILGEDIRLVVNARSEASPVEADAGQLQQVIMNLAVNARDAMPEGGELSLSLENAGGEVELTVSDTGCGMNDETLSHIFEPFFTTKEPGKGTGLGLSIVYGIVNQDGGRISVDSRPGAGTRFVITYPRASSTPVKEALAPRAESYEKGSGSVLIVEDDEAVRKITHTMLVRGGYRVTEAENGEKAIEICRPPGTDFDLLLTDLVMPGIRGTEVAARIRRDHPGIKVIYMTGYSDGKVISECGKDEVMNKPFSPAELLSAVRKAMEATTSKKAC